MWTFSEISVFILLSVQLVYGSTHAVIGNYSQLNPKDCGYSKIAETDTNCFEWHKNPNPSLINGRNATLQEVPWIVHISGFEFYSNNTLKAVAYCSGSLISTQWILTAAHCLFKKGSRAYYLIRFGPDFITDQRYKIMVNLTMYAFIAYPHIGYYEFFDLWPHLFDIGLLKLEKTIDSMKDPLFKQFGSICLPEKNIVNKNFEYAMTAGWGQLNPFTELAQMGYRQILALDEYPFMSSYTIYSNKLDEHTTYCSGDSGGPIWQYYMGRAVIIGIISRSNKGQNDCEEYQVFHVPGYQGINASILVAIRVSKHIDWIINVTQLH